MGELKEAFNEEMARGEELKNQVLSSMEAYDSRSSVNSVEQDDPEKGQGPDNGTDSTAPGATSKSRPDAGTTANTTAEYDREKRNRPMLALENRPRQTEQKQDVSPTTGQDVGPDVQDGASTPEAANQ